jgi:hypothetical protein
MNAYVSAIDTGRLDGLPELMSPEVVYVSPPHTVQFPGNVVARLRSERANLPDLRVSLQEGFTDEKGGRGVAIICWHARGMTSRVCLAFTVTAGKISRIEAFGGLARVLYDVGMLRVA